MNKGQKRVIGTGSPDPIVFFLGESPGRLGADQTGIPFTKDRSGKLLRKMIEEIGLRDEEVYISNVLKCNPRNEQGRNRRPSIKELTNCREYLLAELRIIRPKVTVPLGELAAREFLGEKVCMSKINGKMFSHVEFGAVFPLFHPGYIIRGNYSVLRYRQDFECLRQFIRS
ncbi:MAG: uracil-DNA glycosylase [Candidatus Bathyarchaeia archaeon]|jgi:DNA polymerase